jgi:hypothetical protein
MTDLSAVAVGGRVIIIEHPADLAEIPVITVWDFSGAGPEGTRPLESASRSRASFRRRRRPCLRRPNAGLSRHGGCDRRDDVAADHRR